MARAWTQVSWALARLRFLFSPVFVSVGQAGRAFSAQRWLLGGEAVTAFLVAFLTRREVPSSLARVSTTSLRRPRSLAAAGSSLGSRILLRRLATRGATAFSRRLLCVFLPRSVAMSPDGLPASGHWRWLSSAPQKFSSATSSVPFECPARPVVLVPMLDLFQAAASELQPAAPSTDRSRWPAWSTARRACLRRCGPSPPSRTRRLACWAIFAPQRLRELVPGSLPQALFLLTCRL